MFSVLLAKYLRLEFLSHTRNFQTFPKYLHHFAFLPAMYEDSSSPHSHQLLFFSVFFITVVREYCLYEFYILKYTDFCGVISDKNLV